MKCTLNKLINGIILVESEELIINNDITSCIDNIITITYESKCDKIILYKENIIDDFFILSNKMAGELLQKLANYNIKLAIIGDFSLYNSYALNCFITESNKGNNFSFVHTLEEAIGKLNLKK